jgi:uncharacterized protein
MSMIRSFAAMIIFLTFATLAAAEPMKALLVDGQNVHNWKQTSPLLKRFLEEAVPGGLSQFSSDENGTVPLRKLFVVDVATAPPENHDMSGFHPDFAAHKVVVINYSGDDWPAATQRSFEKYVADGGGVVIVHSSDNTFPNWKAYNEMIGLGGWNGRNEKDGPYVYWKDGRLVRDTTRGKAGEHGQQKPFLLTVRDREHPITKGLPPMFFHAADELYGKLRGPAKNLTVLATAYSNPATGGSGREEPILMTIAYGKGRVFHTVLGHDAPQMHSVAFIATYQRGAEWAATGRVTQSLPADFPTAEKPSVRQATANGKGS